MTVHTLPDIVGPSTATFTIPAGQTNKARWIIFTASGSTAAVVGDSNSGAARGARLVPSIPITYPQNSCDVTDLYDLTNMTAYVPSGTTLTVTYGI